MCNMRRMLNEMVHKTSKNSSGDTDIPNNSNNIIHILHETPTGMAIWNGGKGVNKSNVNNTEDYKYKCVNLWLLNKLVNLRLNLSLPDFLMMSLTILTSNPHR